MKKYKDALTLFFKWRMIYLFMIHYTVLNYTAGGRWQDTIVILIFIYFLKYQCVFKNVHIIKSGVFIKYIVEFQSVLWL